MVINLADRYTTIENPKRDVRVQFIRSMDIEMLGYGFKLNMDVEQLDNLMFPNFLLVYFLSGKGKLTHSGQTMTLQPGSVYLLDSFELYDGFKMSTEPMDYMYIYFAIHPLSRRGVFQQCAFHQGDAFFQQAWTERVRPALEAVRHLNQDHQYQLDFLLHCAVYSLIENILLEQPREMLPLLVEQKEKSNLVDQAYLYVEAHLDEPLNVGQLVNAIGTSRSTLNRVFRDVLQTTAIQALIRFKMYQAIKLMLAGNSVKQTAIALGYSSAFHFSRIFKKVMGKSPTSYMKF